jgi:hypothetical protein
MSRSRPRDEQTSRDVQRAMALVSEVRRLTTDESGQALRNRAAETGVSVHAAALAVMATSPADDLVTGRPTDLPKPHARRHPPERAHSSEEPRMTTGRTIEPGVTTGSADMDTDRLCVAARSVLDRMSDLIAEGLPGGGVQQVTRHAQALADHQSLCALPPAEQRAHAVALRDALAPLTGEQALTLAVWFDDGLGIR